MKIFLSYLLIYGVKSNLMIMNPSGVTEFQREKKYTQFRYISSLCVCLGVLLCSFACYLIKKFLIVPFEINEIYISVVAIIVLLYNLAVATILNKKTTFIYYLYDRSVSYALDSVFIMSVIFTLNMQIEIVEFIISLFAALLAIFITNVLVGFYVRFINKNYVIPSFRKVPITLLLLSIFSILIYYLGQII